MNARLFENTDEGVTRDLSKKIVVDIFDTINRTLDIAPPPHVAIVTAAGATTVGMLATMLQKQTGTPLREDGKPEGPCILLAALIFARFCLNPKEDYIGEAMQDVDVLMKTKRFP